MAALTKQFEVKDEDNGEDAQILIGSDQNRQYWKCIYIRGLERQG